MTFAQADQARQTMMTFDRPSPDQLNLKPGSQCRKLYDRLLEGPTDNGEILFSLRIGNHTGRISDLRDKLRPYLMDIKATPDPENRAKVVYRLAG